MLWVIHNKQELGIVLRRLGAFLETKDQWPVELKPSKYVEHRSKNQNATYWQWCTELSRYFTERGFTLSKDDAHDLLRHKFLGYEGKRIGNTDIRPQLQSTAALDKGEFTHYLEQIDAWAVEHGCQLTYPQDGEYAKLKDS